MTEGTSVGHVDPRVQDVLPWVVRDRRHLHSIPELGFAEEETKAYLKEQVMALGLSVEEAGGGLIVSLRGTRPGHVAAVRADMDGLPVEEPRGLPFASRHQGRMHACGHDAHMAMALGVLRLLHQERDQLAGEVRFLFQPAEEIPPGGALEMIRAGALEGVEAMVGLHVWSSLPVGTVQLNRGRLMANSDIFHIRLQGMGGHGSAPHAAVDTALLAAQVVVNLQTIVSRRVDPLEPAVVTVGQISTGTAANVIPETAELHGTVRTFHPQVRALIRQEITRIAQATAQMAGGRAEVDYLEGYPAVVNPSGRVWDVVAQAAAEVVGAEHVVERAPSMGGEDFAHYQARLPAVFFFLGCGGEGAGAHHSPRFTVDEACLPLGVDILARAARRLAAEGP